MAVGEDLGMRRRIDRVLTRFGTGVEAASRVSFAQSNEVWIAEHVVVRVGRLERSSLSREIALAPAIPAAVGYPEILDHGIVDGYEWMASVRIPGDNLGEAWPALDERARADAVTDLWSRLRILHTTDVRAARSAGCIWTPYYQLDSARANARLASLVERGVLDSTTGGRLGAILAKAFEATALVPLALTHTDASPMNAVRTPTGQAIPVDLEFACVTPVDLELENLFRNLFLLSDTTTPLVLAELAADLLGRPGAAARIQGYAVLRDLWALRLWLGKASDTSGLATWAPLRHLHGHAAGTSWLSQTFRD